MKIEIWVAHLLLGLIDFSLMRVVLSCGVVILKLLFLCCCLRIPNAEDCNT